MNRVELCSYTFDICEGVKLVRRARVQLALFLFSFQVFFLFIFVLDFLFAPFRLLFVCLMAGCSVCWLSAGGRRLANRSSAPLPFEPVSQSLPFMFLA